MKQTASHEAWSKEEERLTKREFILLRAQKGQPQLGPSLDSHCKCDDKAEWKVTLM